MVIEMLLNNEIQIFFFSILFTIFKEKTWLCALLKKIKTLSFGQNINKISNIKNDVLCNVLNQVM